MFLRPRLHPRSLAALVVAIPLACSSGGGGRGPDTGGQATGAHSSVGGGSVSAGGGGINGGGAAAGSGASGNTNAVGASGGRGTGGAIGAGGGNAATVDGSADFSGGDADTGIVDAMPTDARPLPVGCAGMFCEDFEKGIVDPAVWTVTSSSGQPVASVQQTTVAHGRYAVQFHALPNIVSYDFIITKNAPAGLRGHHFGRAYFYVSPRPPAAHTEYLFAGSAGFPTLKYLEVAGINNQWQLTYVNLQTTPTTESYSSGGATPLMKWMCLEWEFNDVPDQITVFVDGKQDFAFPSIVNNGVSAELVGGFTSFGFGYYAWHPATYAFDLYFDDIVLDTKRVGCLP